MPSFGDIPKNLKNLTLKLKAHKSKNKHHKSNNGFDIINGMTLK